MLGNIEAIKSKIDSIFDEVVEIRREIHMHPELSEHEEETAKFIAAKLDEMGISYESGVAGNGIVACIYGKNKSHAVGIRADIDALPLQEKTDVPFRSLNDGVMHACGHDIHTAILLGTGKILKSMEDELPGCVKLFFQPAEETIGGANQMIDAGCLENPKVESVLGIHVEDTLEVGKIRITSGAMNAASCEFKVTVKGQTCHGAHPTAGTDALLPACTMVSSLQSLITRNVDPADSALITVGRFNSGSKNNIISGEAVFSGIIRTLNLERRTYLKSRIESMCKSIAEGYGATCDVEFKDSYPSLENDPILFDWVRETAEDALGKSNVELSTKPSMGADDFSYFCHSSRGLYYCIGIRRPDGPECYSIHNDSFYPDEDCIKVGILTEVLASLKILKEELK